MALRGHPPGAYFLAFIEALERFGYYGMRGLLVLFLTAAPAAGGLGWSSPQALSFYGFYTASIWLTPLAGGWLADRFAGARRCVLWGGWVICSGMVVLWAGSAVAARSTPDAPVAGAAPLFVAGLVLVAIGIGLLKGNITVLLGRLYTPADPRREEAFTIYYVAINIGVVLAALIAGTAGEKLGWAAGFGVCAVVLSACMLLYTLLQGRLVFEHRDVLTATSGPAADGGTSASGAAAFVLILTLFAAGFFCAYEQIGGFVHLTIFHDVDRTVGGFEIPATWFLASTGVFCILIGPFVSPALRALGRFGVHDDAPTRFALGLALGAAAFGVLGYGMSLAGREPIALFWPVAFYLVLTLAELALAPAGFSMVTRYAPPRAAGRFMGLWFLALALGSLAGGQLGALAADWPKAAFAGGLALALGAAAALLMTVRPALLRLVALRRAGPQPTSRSFAPP